MLRVPAYQAYAASRAASGIASSLLQTVIAWQVYATTGSALDLGLIGLVRFVPALAASLVGGAVVDAYDRKRVLVLSSIWPLVASVALLWANRGEIVSLPFLYGIVLVTGIAASFESPARQAVLPSIVPRAMFSRALTFNSTLGALTSVTGPALAGALIAVSGVELAYAVNAVLVAVALVAVLPMRVASLPRTIGGLRLQAIREGIAFVRHSPVLLGAMTLDMFAVIFGGAKALLPVYAVSVLDVGAAGFGILSASSEVGAVATAVVLVMLPLPRETGRTLLLSVAAFGVATIAFGLSRSFPLSVALYALVGVADQLSVVMRLNTVQLSTPDALRGRVSAVNQVFVSASNQLGMVESGIVAAFTSATFAVVSGGIACLVVVVVMAIFNPALRKYELPER